METNYRILFAHIALLVILSGTCWHPSQAAQKLPFVRPDFGRWVVPTVGQVWPKPQQQSSSQSVFALRPTNFQFQLTGQRCAIIEDAIKRYYDIIFYPGGKPVKVFKMDGSSLNEISTPMESRTTFLDSVEVDLKNPCEERPNDNMLESYNITIDTPDNPLKASIVSDSVWGILRGLETFSQLVYASAETGVSYQINGTEIVDFPRFSHRGLLIDTARHFIPVKVLRMTLDLMAQNKMNVFHWHMTDDSSFPYVSALFPDLSRYGAYQPHTHIYTPNDVREIVEYARVRGVRVIPEFDTPGHTHSWGPKAVPGLLTECYDDNGVLIPNKFGPINPIKEENFLFLKKFFEEVFSLFPDPYIHLGGDEVNFSCWGKHPDIKTFMEDKGWAYNDFGKLEQHYMEHLMNVTSEVSQNKMRYIVWQELVDNGAVLPNDTIIDIWKDTEIDNISYIGELDKVTQLGYKVILSSPWYLNLISYGVDWTKYYWADPLDFNGTAEQKKLVMGGEASMWGEYADAVNLIPTTWPRASTVAERLWSSRSVNNATEATYRLEEHRCRLLHRGFNVAPVNGANFCDPEWDTEGSPSSSPSPPPTPSLGCTSCKIFGISLALPMLILTSILKN